MNVSYMQLAGFSLTNSKKFNLGSWSSFQVAYFIKLYKSGPGPGPSEKADPRSLEKADPILEFTVWVKD